MEMLHSGSGVDRAEGMSNLHCGCWLLGASYIVKEATIPQSESISVVFPVEYQRGDCGLLVSALWLSSHVATVTWGIKARITLVGKTS